MKKIITIILTITLLWNFSFSQDIIKLKTGRDKKEDTKHTGTYFMSVKNINKQDDCGGTAGILALPIASLYCGGASIVSYVNGDTEDGKMYLVISAVTATMTYLIISCSRINEIIIKNKRKRRRRKHKFHNRRRFFK